jgi:hypothetical protein
VALLVAVVAGLAGALFGGWAVTRLDPELRESWRRGFPWRALLAAVSTGTLVFLTVWDLLDDALPDWWKEHPVFGSVAIGLLMTCITVLLVQAVVGRIGRRPWGASVASATGLILTIGRRSGDYVKRRMNDCERRGGGTRAAAGDLTAAEELAVAAQRVSDRLQVAVGNAQVPNSAAGEHALNQAAQRLLEKAATLERRAELYALAESGATPQGTRPRESKLTDVGYAFGEFAKELVAFDDLRCSRLKDAKSEIAEHRQDYLWLPPSP